MSDQPSEPRSALAVSAVTVVRGSLQISLEQYQAFFAGVSSVGLVLREDAIHVVPLIAGSPGGFLLKIRNARGDRVIHAQEFFRDKGFVEDFAAHEAQATWNADVMAWVVVGVPKSQPQPQPSRDKIAPNSDPTSARLK